MADLSGQASGRGFNSPLRFEGSVDDCEVVGKIPPELNGAFYRVGAEWYYPPKFADDAILNADGYVSMFRIKGGKVDYKGRWVKTHRFQKEREARRQLYGYYRNPYTDDPSVRDPKHQPSDGIQHRNSRSRRQALHAEGRRPAAPARSQHPGNDRPLGLPRRLEERDLYCPSEARSADGRDGCFGLRGNRTRER